MTRWHRLGIAVGLVVLVGYGSPTPEHPLAGTTAGSKGTIGSPPAGDAVRIGLAASDTTRQAPMQTSPLELTVQHASKPSALNANDPRIPVTASPPGTVSADEQTQRQARQSWYAEAREHPEVGVRLQALEFWTQQTGDVLDPVTYALVDGDEHVRARAQELWEQQLMREAAAARSVQEEGHRGQLQQ